uniref:Protein HGH1 homolog n=1 Tax=Panagrolaimus superbus TaxID=310955 RepID=A0A914YV51_9BILA
MSTEADNNRQEIDEKRNEMNERNSAITDDDAEIIANMLVPKKPSDKTLSAAAQEALETRLTFALGYIRNATGEHYAVDFVMHPKIMSALTAIILQENLSPEKLGTLLDIFINTTSRSQPLAQTLIEQHNFVELINQLRTTEKKEKVILLLSNLAGMSPELVHERLHNIDPNYMDTLIAMFTSGEEGDVGAHYGQVAVSLSVIETIRQHVIEKHLDKFLPLCGSLNPNRQSRATAISFLRNLAVDTRLHNTLLSKPEYLTAVLEPIMSKEYEFSDEEMDKLPQSLQYFNELPTVDDDTEQIVIDTLYKLCDSKFGRETLRQNSVYPLLREFHKIQKRRETDDEIGAGSSALGIIGPGAAMMQVLNEDNILEGLIGILIRNEDDIGLPSDVNYGDIQMEE